MKKVELLKFAFFIVTLIASSYASAEYDSFSLNRYSVTGETFEPYLPSYIGYVTSHSEGNDKDLAFQISVKNRLINTCNFYFAYTQKSFWSISESSAPFRETNFSPEFFWVGKPSWDSVEAVQIGLFRHESTGEAGPGSHGWNISYIEPAFKIFNVYVIPRIWVPSILHKFKKDNAAPDNTDIWDYYGNGDITFIAAREGVNKHELKFGFAPIDSAVAWEYKLDVAWRVISPFEIKWNPSLFLKLRNGYGESLKNYNKKVSSISIGVSLAL